MNSAYPSRRRQRSDFRSPLSLPSLQSSVARSLSDTDPQASSPSAHADTQGTFWQLGSTNSDRESRSHANSTKSTRRTSNTSNPVRTDVAFPLSNHLCARHQRSVRDTTTLKGLAGCAVDQIPSQARIAVYRQPEASIIGGHDQCLESLSLASADL